MRVAIVSSEAAPFAKTGGLADMVGSLAAALARRGARRDPRPAAYRRVPRTWRRRRDRHGLRGAGRRRRRARRRAEGRRPARARPPGSCGPIASSTATDCTAGRVWTTPTTPTGSPGSPGPRSRCWTGSGRTARCTATTGRRVSPSRTSGCNPSATRRWPRRGRCSPCTTSVIRDGSTRPSSRVSRWTGALLAALRVLRRRLFPEGRPDPRGPVDDGQSELCRGSPDGGAGTRARRRVPGAGGRPRGDHERRRLRRLGSGRGPSHRSGLFRRRSRRQARLQARPAAAAGAAAGGCAARRDGGPPGRPEGARRPGRGPRRPAVAGSCSSRCSEPATRTTSRALSVFAARHPDRMAIRIGFDEELAHAIEAAATCS